MHTIEEIRAMSPAEKDALQRKLGRQLIIKRVVLPISLGVAFNVVATKLASRSFSNH